jgi:hypothetical protein
MNGMSMTVSDQDRVLLRLLAKRKPKPKK